MARRTEGLGWIPDLPDHRDVPYAAPRGAVAELAATVDLRPGCPPVHDQGRLADCAANTVGAAVAYGQMRQGKPATMPSRLFVYYNERALEGTIAADSGGTIRGALKAARRYGVPPESDWPYDPALLSQKPTAAAYDDGLRNQVLAYRRLPRDLNQMRACLSTGHPFAFGFSVYESFMSDEVARTGVAPMPHPSEPVVGGHCALAVGYDDAAGRFLARNSWGTGWGMAGYFTLPYAYLAQPTLSADFWTIRLVE